MMFHGLERGTTNPMKDKNGNVVASMLRDSSIRKNLESKGYFPESRIQHKIDGTRALKAAAYERIINGVDVYVRAYETRGRLIPNAEGAKHTIAEFLEVINQKSYQLGIVLPNGTLVGADGQPMDIPNGRINTFYKDKDGDYVLLDSTKPDSIGNRIRSRGSVFVFLSEEEATGVYQLLYHGLKYGFGVKIGSNEANKAITDKEGNVLFDGITPQAALDLITYPFLNRTAPHNVARNLSINFKSEERNIRTTTVTIGDTTYNRNSLVDNKDGVIAHLMENKVRSVKQAFLTNNGEDYIIDITNRSGEWANDEIVVLGEKINRKTTYTSWVAEGEDPALTTDLQIEGDGSNGPPVQGIMYHPQVYFEGASGIIEGDNIENHLGSYPETVVPSSLTDQDVEDEVGDVETESNVTYGRLDKIKNDTGLESLIGDRVEIVVYRDGEMVVRELIITGKERDGAMVFRELNPVTNASTLYAYSDHYLFKNLRSHTRRDITNRGALEDITQEEAEAFEGGFEDVRDLANYVAERSRNPQEVAEYYVKIKELLDREFNEHPLKRFFEQYGLVTWSSFYAVQGTFDSSRLLKYVGSKFAPGLANRGSDRTAIDIHLWVDYYNRDRAGNETDASYGEDLTASELASQIAELSYERAEPLLADLRYLYRELTGRWLTDNEAQWVVSEDNPFNVQEKGVDASDTITGEEKGLIIEIPEISHAVPYVTLTGEFEHDTETGERVKFLAYPGSDMEHPGERQASPEAYPIEYLKDATRSVLQSGPDYELEDEGDEFKSKSWARDNASTDDTTEELFLDRQAVTQERSLEGRIDIENEVAWLRKKLPYIPVEVIDDLIRLHGTEAYGMFKSGIITLSKIAIPGTIYHEGFHAVFNSYLNNRQREEIIAEARETYDLEGLTDRQVEEFLAEEFRKVSIDLNTDYTWGQKIKRFFERLLNFVKALRNQRVGIQQLFHNIELGVYAYKPKAIYRSAYYDDNSFLKLDNFNNSEKLELRKGLAFIAVKFSGLDYDNEEDRKTARERLPELEHIEHASFPSARKYLIRMAALHRREGRIEKAEKLEQIIKSPSDWQAVVDDLKWTFERFGVGTGDLEKSLMDDVKEEDEGNGGLGYDTRKPYEFSQKERARSSIKLVLAMLPAMEGHGRIKNGEHFGFPEFTPFGATWGKLETLLEGNVPVSPEKGEIESLLAKISRVTTFDPNLAYMITVINKMKKKPRMLKQLALAFQLSDSEFRSFLWNPIYDKKGNVTAIEGKDFESKRQMASRAITGQWASNMESMKLQLRPELIREFIASIKAVQNAITEYQSGNLIADEMAMSQTRFIDEKISELVTALNLVGIEASPAALDYVVSVSRGVHNDRFGNLQRYVEDLMELSVAPRKSKKRNTFQSLANLAEGEGTDIESLDLSARDSNPIWSIPFQELSEGTAFTEGQGHDSTVTIRGNLVRWIYGPQRWIQRRWAQIMEDPEAHMQDYESSYFVKTGSTFYRKLMRVNPNTKKPGRAIQNFKVLLGLEVRNTRNPSSSAKTFEELSNPDKTVTILNMMLQGVMDEKRGAYEGISKFPLNNMSDKLDQYFGNGYQPIRIVKKLGVNETDGVNPLTTEFTNEAKAVIRRMMVSELMRTRVVYDELSSLPIDKLIQNFHGDVDMRDGETEGEYRARLKQEANGLQMLMFPELSADVLRNADQELFDLLYESRLGTIVARMGETEVNDDGDVIARDHAYDDKTITRLEDYAEKWLQRRLKTDFENLVQMELMRKVAEDEYAIANTFIHNPTLKWYSSGSDNLSLIDAELTAVIDALTNSLITGVEQMYLNHGDWAFYKDVADIGKRASSIITSGLHPIIYENDIKPTFNVAVLRDVIAPSEYLGSKDFKAKVKQILREQWHITDEKLLERRAEEIVAPYRDINTTDAQAYITLDRFKEIMVGIGRWRDEHEDVFEDLKAGRPIDPLKIGLFTQPLKGVYYNLEKRGEHQVPVYLKYSQMVLLPALIAGNPMMENLLASMNSEENGGKVDEAVYISGVKLGASGIRSLESFIDGPSDFAPITLQNQYWKLQTETPWKGMNDRKIGTQQRKNVFAAIADYFLFEVRGQDMTASEWKRDMNHLYSALSDIEMEGLKDKWGVIDRGDHYEVLKHGAFVKMLKKRAAREELPPSVIEMFDLDESGEIKVPFSTHAMKHSIQNIVLGVIRRYSVESNSFGGSMIQISGAGIASMRGFSKLPKEQRDKLKSMFPELIGPLLQGRDFENAPAIAMQPHNIKKINEGKKTATTRREFHESGFYRMPDDTIIHLNGTQIKDFTKLSLKRQNEWARREGFADIEDAKTNATFQQTKDFIAGKKPMWVYRIRTVSSSGEVDKASTLEGMIGFSGGAVGSDTAWGDIGAEYGMHVIDFVGEVHEWEVIRRQRPNIHTLTDEELDEADEHVEKANETLKRTYPVVNKNTGEANVWVNDHLRRNWFQVKDAKAVYAIAKGFQGTTNVQGGTGWAVQMAIDNNKPVFVHVESQNSWFSWDYAESKWVRMDSPPTLVNNAALVGTRGTGPEGYQDISEKQKNAIRTVFENTIQQRLPSIATGNNVYKPGDVLLPSWFKDKLPQSVYNEDGTYDQGEVRKFFTENPELARIVTYRIPGQARFSIDAARVVGLLPPEMGDSIIMYDEVTAKTGSDFDIDKMFLMLPEFYTNKKGEIKVHRMDTGASLKEDGKTPTRAAIGRYQRYIETHMRKPANARPEDWARYRRTKNTGEEGQFFREYAKRHGLVTLSQFARTWSVERQNGKQAIANRIIEMYHGLMSHPAVYLHGVSPIDQIKLSDLADEIEGLTGRKKATMPDFFTITNQVDLGSVFSDAKQQTGKIATHIVNHALLQDSGVMVKGRGNVPFLQFNNIWDANKEYIIVDVLSAILNGSLDAVKNPYLHYLGMNKFTANVAVTMIRNGIPYKKVFKFLKQPIIEEMSRQKRLGESDFHTRKTTRGDWIRQELAEKAEKAMLKAQDAKLRKLFPELGEEGMTPNFLDAEREKLYLAEKEVLSRPRIKIPKPIKEALSERDTKKGRLTYISEEMLDYYLKPENQGTGDYYFFQKMFIEEYESWASVSQNLSSFMAATKVDTKGPGNSIASLVATRNRIVSMLNGDNTNVQGAESLFKNPDSMVTTYYNNSVLFSLKLLKKYFIELSPFYESATKKIRASQADLRVTNEDSIKEVHNSIYAYQLMEMLEASGISHQQIKDWFEGDNNMTVRLKEIKARHALAYVVKNKKLDAKASLNREAKSANYSTNLYNQYLKEAYDKIDEDARSGKLDEEAKHSITGNDFLDFLDVYTPKEGLQFVRGKQNRRDAEKLEGLIAGWEDLYSSPEDQKFAKEIGYYSIVTSGGRRGVFTFHDATLNSQVFRDHLGIDDYFKEKMKGIDAGLSYHADVVAQVFAHNYTNQNLVHQLSDIELMDADDHVHEVNDTTITMNITGAKSLKLITGVFESESEDGGDAMITFKPFFYNSSSDKLYQLATFSSSNIATYMQVPKLGHHQDADRKMEYNTNSGKYFRLITPTRHIGGDEIEKAILFEADPSKQGNPLADQNEGKLSKVTNLTQEEIEENARRTKEKCEPDGQGDLFS
jgi:hypothetical protein